MDCHLRVAMTGETSTVMQFNNPALELHANLAGAIDKLQRRGARPLDGTGYKIRVV